MNIAEYIPVGHDNAVTRSALALRTGMTDRQVRREIEKANASGEVAIINMHDGSGYFRPDLGDEIDYVVLEFFVKMEEARIRSTQKKLTGPRLVLEQIGAAQ